MTFVVRNFQFFVFSRHLKNQIIPKLQLGDAWDGVTQNFHPESGGPSLGFVRGVVQLELLVVFIFRRTRRKSEIDRVRSEI